ncbi:MAG: hypothetical protein HN673_17600 [Rhodospirillales bacterium]|nr:hypothetical protein [Rhodospirillales bacterium]
MIPPRIAYRGEYTAIVVATVSNDLPWHSNAACRAPSVVCVPFGAVLGSVTITQWID